VVSVVHKCKAAEIAPNPRDNHSKARRSLTNADPEN
jgi:hypothetical protein